MDVNIILNQLDWCDKMGIANYITVIDDKNGVIFDSEFWEIVKVPKTWNDKSFRVKEICVIKRIASFNQILSCAAKLNPLGRDDWRLPAMDELRRIYKHKKELLPFIENQHAEFFSSDTLIDKTSVNDDSLRSFQYTKEFYDGTERGSYNFGYKNIMMVR